MTSCYTFISVRIRLVSYNNHFQKLNKYCDSFHTHFDLHVVNLIELLIKFANT
jgi:hypothetical protein